MTGPWTVIAFLVYLLASSLGCGGRDLDGGSGAGGTAGGAGSGAGAGEGGGNEGGGGAGGVGGSSTSGGGPTCATCPPGEMAISTWQCAPINSPEYGCGRTTPLDPCPIGLHVNWTCVDNACAVGSCEAGWGDCNHDPRDGCEVELTSPSHCGSCGATCPGVCTPAGCAASCPLGLANCGGACVDLVTPDLLRPRLHAVRCPERRRADLYERDMRRLLPAHAVPEQRRLR